MFVEPSKIASVIRLLQIWASARGLEPSERPYPARSRTPRELRFSAADNPELERAYKTHWVSPDVSEAERARLNEREARRPDLVVIQPLKEFTCSVCGAVGDGPLIMEDAGPVCMACADLDHLVFLASGDAALEHDGQGRGAGCRRSCLRFSRARKRYERQGTLVEEQALERAEAECLADEQARTPPPRARSAPASRPGP